MLDLVFNSLFVFVANLMQQWTLQSLLRTMFQIGTLNWMFFCVRQEFENSIEIHDDVRNWFFNHEG